MTTPFIGEIKIFAGSFAIRGWAMCDGQLLAISQNTALFSILGTFYGGNGVNTFGLPDFRGRVPIHQGQGLGLSPYTIGQVAGNENATLTVSNLPAHTHTLPASSANGTTGTPGLGEVMAQSTARDRIYSTAAADTQLFGTGINPTGSSVPFSIVQPYLAVTFLIALVGVFPTRN
jgi:microcystin-dependent protein